MALRVVWTLTAIKERRAILEFYKIRNGNSHYSRELANHLRMGMDLVASQDLLGKSTDIEGVRCLFVLDYSLFYKLTEEQVAVLSVWDNRRDPKLRPY